MQPPDKNEMRYYEDKLRPRSFWRRYSWRIVAIVSILLVLVLGYTVASLLLNRPMRTRIISAATPTAAVAQQTANPAATVAPTSVNSLTPAATPTQVTQTGLPCVVNVGTWTDGSSDWKVEKGVLLDDGTNTNWNSISGPTIVAPCDLGTTANYAVETKIQVINPQSNSCFGITVRGNPSGNNWQGYKAGVGDCESLTIARLSGPDYFYDSAIVNASFNPGISEHTYRVEVKDNTIKFFIDGGLISQMTDNRYLSGAQVGLWSQVQLDVLSFQVTAL
jgi:hypothetical protein